MLIIMCIVLGIALCISLFGIKELREMNDRQSIEIISLHEEISMLRKYKKAQEEKENESKLEKPFPVYSIY